MTVRLKAGLAILAIGFTCAIAAWVESFPFYVGLFVVGPLAFIWFVIPGLIAPLLVERLSVGRKNMIKVTALTLFTFAASAAYLRFVPSYQLNDSAELGIFGLWIAGAVLTLLLAVGYLHESRLVTWVYHLVLVTWFFAVAFPYLGEFI